MTGRDPRLFLTLDVDWSHDDIVAHAIDLLAQARVPLTVFVTHESPMLERLRATDHVELGVHPNLNPLVDGTADAGTSAARVLEAMQTLVPEARCVRFHSLVQSSRLLDRCADLGYTHESNTFIPATSGTTLHAWAHPRGRLIRVPYLFDDSLAGLLPGAWDVATILDNAGLKVVNFHPGRLFLNLHASEIPEAVSAVRQDPERYLRYRNDPDVIGSATFLGRLIDEHRRRGGSFGTITEIGTGTHGHDDAGQSVRPAR